MAGRMTRAALLALFAGAAIAGPAAAQLPKPMTETELKAAGARQVTADELRRMLTGNTSYVVLLKNFGPGKTGGVIANYYRDARTRVQKFPNGPKVESNWWLEGNSRCVEERGPLAGNLCSNVWDLAGTLYLCPQPAGDCPMSFRNMQGNPEGL